MRTAYCPKAHRALASVRTGLEHGHLRGKNYHDVDVVLSRMGTVIRCHVCESWGSVGAEGDEEDGRKEVVTRGGAIWEVVDSVRKRAIAAGIEGIALTYLERALSKAEDEAEETVDFVSLPTDGWERFTEVAFYANCRAISLTLAVQQLVDVWLTAFSNGDLDEDVEEEVEGE